MAVFQPLVCRGCRGTSPGGTITGIDRLVTATAQETLLNGSLLRVIVIFQVASENQKLNSQMRAARSPDQRLQQAAGVDFGLPVGCDRG